MVVIIDRLNCKLGEQWNVFAVHLHCDNIHPERRRSVRTQEAIANVRQSVENDGRVSLRRRAQQLLNLCPSTLWNMLRQDIGLYAYKIQLVQDLKPNDHRLRCTFGEWAEALIGLQDCGTFA